MINDAIGRHPLRSGGRITLSAVTEPNDLGKINCNFNQNLALLVANGASSPFSTEMTLQFKIMWPAANRVIDQQGQGRLQSKITLGNQVRRKLEDGHREGLARYGVVLGRQREAGSVTATKAQGDQGRQACADVVSAGSAPYKVLLAGSHLTAQVSSFTAFGQITNKEIKLNNTPSKNLVTPQETEFLPITSRVRWELSGNNGNSTPDI
ncbi:hypothetical protein B0H13DRAFT_1890148 [Mycena leptocephala]|nr:hypothetical protein B0H13DRAFT_1890148 [Mycena leptocephala]